MKTLLDVTIKSKLIEKRIKRLKEDIIWRKSLNDAHMVRIYTEKLKKAMKEFMDLQGEIDAWGEGADGDATFRIT